MAVDAETRARQLGQQHGQQQQTPFGDLLDEGSAELMAALGETSPTSKANHDARDRMIAAYAAAWRDETGRPYPGYVHPDTPLTSRQPCCRYHGAGGREDQPCTDRLPARFSLTADDGLETSAADMTEALAAASADTGGHARTRQQREEQAMTEQDTTARRFTLDESKARKWLEKVVAAYEWDMYGEGDEPTRPEGDDLPGIGQDWQAADPGNEDDIYRLVRQAVDGEIIGRPDDKYDLDFEYVADEDGGYYYFLVRIGYRLKLASLACEMRKIDGRDESGVAAALAVLNEAVNSANGVLANLDEYVTSRAAAS
jgi:hypothetical protein